VRSFQALPMFGFKLLSPVAIRVNLRHLFLPDLQKLRFNYKKVRKPPQHMSIGRTCFGRLDCLTGSGVLNSTTEAPSP
jgi:hypothetical protein